MAFNTTPITGIDFDVAAAFLPYQISENSDPTPLLGTVVKGDDGRDYVLVQASAALGTPATEVTITEPAFTVAAGAGGFETVVAMAQDDFGWVRRTTL